jgi:cell division protein FtsB
MRRKRSREANVFSVAALDLFASAMGVFLLIALIAFPFYLKSNPDLVRQLAESKEKTAKLERNNQQLRAENRKLEAEKVATLIGISTNAKSFVIVVDMSGSMEQYRQIVLETVDKILDNLDDDVRVQILGFHGDDLLIPWQVPHGLRELKGSGRKEAKAFMRRLTREFGAGTPTFLALKEALRYDAEAVILVTDGAPSFTQPGEIVQEVTVLNHGDKQIFSIAVGEYRAQPILVEFLEALSRQNGGSFLGISSY